jgi:hypothetical protein
MLTQKLKKEEEHEGDIHKLLALWKRYEKKGESLKKRFPFRER